jgi:hypothetical protein
MNKIDLSTKDKKKLLKEYKKIVFEETRDKLTFVIGAYSLRKGLIDSIDLTKKKFLVKGRIFNNKLKNVNRKTILNILFEKAIKVDAIEYKNLNIKGYLKSLYQNHFIDIDNLLCIYDNLEVILFEELSNPKVNSALSKLRNKFKTNADKNILDAVFEYKRYFHQTDKNKNYFGFKLAQTLNTNICVYCNREYISTITDENGKKLISPAFDHFLSQSEYPYMAISLFNLIPSCYSCNSQLKHDEPFNLNDYLYPFEDSYEGKAEFKTYWNKTFLNSKISETELVNVNDITIEIEPISKPVPKIFGDLSLPQNDRKGNLKVFQTKLVYDSIHRDSVLEIITQFRVHSKKDVESLKTSYDFIKNDADVYQFYFKNYMNEEDFNKRPLARMTRDIAKQLDSIYKLNIFK